MNLRTQENLFRDFINQQRDVMLKKGNDYAGEDRLANFKIAGIAAGLSPERQCLSLITTKIARLNNLLSNDQNVKPNFESVEDTVKDLANYSFLLYCLLREINEENEKNEVSSKIPTTPSKPPIPQHNVANQTKPISPNYILLKD